MSEERLNFQQKLFAVIEGMVRETHVRDFPLDIPVPVYRTDFSLDTRAHELNWSIPVSLVELDPAIHTATAEIVGEIAQPTVTDAAVEELKPKVKDEPVEMYHDPKVYQADIHLSTHTVDFFKRYKVSSKFKYKVVVRDLPTRQSDVNIRKLNLTIYPIIRDNLPLFLGIPVEKKPAVLNFIKETEQLYYWKRAIIKTGKDARKLHLIGIYTGIPRMAVDNIKINYTSRRLNYNYIVNFNPGKGAPFKSIALFNDLETQKSVMVSKDA